MKAKNSAAEKAVSAIEAGMVVGLGTGSTAAYAIHAIAERVKQGLDITAIPTSHQSEKLARSLNIPLRNASDLQGIHLTIDGADEVDSNLNLIKGGGGSLLREKITAFNSGRFFVIIDDSKLVSKLGTFPLPVEIAPFAAALTLQQIRAKGCEPVLRKSGDDLFVTDNGNNVADCRLPNSADIFPLARQIRSIPGVVETGLFPAAMVSAIFVGHADGEVDILSR